MFIVRKLDTFRYAFFSILYVVVNGPRQVYNFYLLALQVMNQVNKEIQRAMSLKQVGASFFDTAGTVKYGQHRLEIWPGITSTIRSREYDSLICIEPTHKVVR